MINYVCWTMMRWYYFIYIAFIHYLIIGTNNWICISFFLKSNWCVKWTLGLNIDRRKDWSSYNIITVWCIQNIRFDIVNVWVNSSALPILRLGQKLPVSFGDLNLSRYGHGEETRLSRYFPRAQNPPKWVFDTGKKPSTIDVKETFHVDPRSPGYMA